jgi:hypothetical protein
VEVGVLLSSQQLTQGVLPLGGLAKAVQDHALGLYEGAHTTVILVCLVPWLGTGDEQAQAAVCATRMLRPGLVQKRRGAGRKRRGNKKQRKGGGGSGCSGGKE